MRMTGIGALGFSSEMVNPAIDGGSVFVRAGGAISRARLSTVTQPVVPSYKGDVVMIPLPPTKEGITARLIPQPLPATPALPNRGQQAPARIIVSTTAASGGGSGAGASADDSEETPAPAAKPSLLPLGLLAWLLFS